MDWNKRKHWYVTIKKELATPNAKLATPFLLRFLEVIPIQGMRAVEKTVSIDEVVMKWFKLKNQKNESVQLGQSNG